MELPEFALRRTSQRNNRYGHVGEVDIDDVVYETVQIEEITPAGERAENADVGGAASIIVVTKGAKSFTGNERAFDRLVRRVIGRCHGAR